MAQDNATVNLYINSEQAKSNINALKQEFASLAAARKEALSVSDYQKASAIDAQMVTIKRQLTNATKGQLDMEKALANISKISVNQLVSVRRTLTNELNNLNRDTDEYIAKRKQLIAIESELKNATSRTNSEQQKGLTSLQKITPTIDLTSLFFKAANAAKAFIAEVWNVSQRLQSDAKKAAVVFGDELGYVEYQATKASKAMGVTNSEFVAMAANTADLLVPLGFTRKEAAEMSVDLQGLTGALNEWSAGKYGAEEVSARLTKAVLGETESLKELGIAIRLDSAEYKDLVKKKMEDANVSDVQARALATLDLIYAKTEDAQNSYTSSGNQMLRFQNSAKRGWNNMIESIGNYFAFSVDERLAKEVRQFKALSDEVDGTAGHIDTLTSRYTQLLGQSELNTDEQAELRNVIDELVQIVPNAVTGFDEYGRALGVNLSVVNQFSEGVRLMRLEMQKEVIGDVTDRLADQMDELHKAQAKLNSATYYQQQGEDRGYKGDAKAKLDENVGKAALAVKELQTPVGETIEMLMSLGMSLDEISEASNKEFRFGVWSETSKEELESVRKLTASQTSQQAFSLQSNKEYNDAILKLKEDLKNGVLASQEEYNDAVLQLEIDSYKAQIDSNKYTGEQLEQLKENLLSRELQQTQNARKKKEAAIAAAEKAELLRQQQSVEKQAKLKSEADAKLARDKELSTLATQGEGDIAVLTKQYEDKLKALGLYNRQEEELTTMEKAALLQLETEYSRKLSSLQLATANKTLSSYQTEMDEQLQALKIAQGEEFAQAETLEELKLIMTRSYSAEEIAAAESLSEAKKMVLAQYDEETKSETETLLEELLSVYERAVTELSSSGSLFGDAVSLTDEDAAKLSAVIKQLKSELAALKLVAGDEGEDKREARDKPDILGMSGDDWDTLFENFAEAENKMELLQGAAQAIGGAWGEVNALIDANAQKELAEYEKLQDDKKAALDDQLNRGVISQESYNAKVAAIEEETATRREELEKEQAERNKALAIFNAVVSTAVGIAKAFELGPIAGPILAGVIAALGAVQIAAIVSEPIPGAEGGGYLDVVRSQDGKPYKAQYSPNSRGYVDSPTVLVGESGSEFVANHQAVSNPTIRPVLDIIDRAQRNGSVGSLNLSEDVISPQRYVVPGRESGGSISTPTSAPSAPASIPSGANDSNKSLEDAVRLLVAQLKVPISAYVSMTGRDGLLSKLNDYNNQTNNSKV